MPEPTTELRCPVPNAEAAVMGATQERRGADAAARGAIEIDSPAGWEQAYPSVLAGVTRSCYESQATFVHWDFGLALSGILSSHRRTRASTTEVTRDSNPQKTCPQSV